MGEGDGRIVIVFVLDDDMVFWGIEDSYYCGLDYNFF